MTKRKIFPVFIALLVILSVFGILSVLTTNEVISNRNIRGIRKKQ